MNKTLQILNIFFNNILAGGKSGAGNPLLNDFKIVARKLEEFGFIYHKGAAPIFTEVESGQESERRPDVRYTLRYD
jgi:hypothetical protein